MSEVEEATGTTEEVVPGVVLEDGQLRTTDDTPGERPRHRRAVVELLHFLLDSGKLLFRIAKDDRVPWSAKIVAGGAVAYLVSPINLLSNTVPGVGTIDDIFVVSRAVRHLFSSAGYDIIYDLWPGSEDGFALLMFISGVRD